MEIEWKTPKPERQFWPKRQEQTQKRQDTTHYQEHSAKLLHIAILRCEQTSRRPNLPPDWPRGQRPPRVDHIARFRNFRRVRGPIPARHDAFRTMEPIPPQDHVSPRIHLFRPATLSPATFSPSLS